MSIQALIQEPLPEPVPLVEQCLDRGDKLILTAGSKGNKTWNLMDLAYCISAGVPEWWGMKVHPGRVLYLNFELKPWQFRKRMLEFAQSYGRKLEDNGNLDVWNLRGFTRNYAELCADIKKVIESGTYVLILVDPLYKFNSSDRSENDATDMTLVMNALEGLAVDLDVAIAFAHHSPKGDMNERAVLDRGSGSGVLARDPDTIINVMKLKDQTDAFKAEFVFRNFPPRAALGLRLQHPRMYPDNTIETDPMKEADKETERLLKLLPASGFTSKDWEQAAKERLDMSRATFHRKKSTLHMEDRVEIENGVWIPMTPGRVVAE